MTTLKARVYLKQHVFDADEDDVQFYLELFIREKDLLIRLTNTSPPRIHALIRTSTPGDVAEEMQNGQIGQIRNLQDVKVSEIWVQELLDFLDSSQTRANIPISFPISLKKPVVARRKRART